MKYQHLSEGGETNITKSGGIAIVYPEMQYETCRLSSIFLFFFFFDRMQNSEKLINPAEHHAELLPKVKCLADGEYVSRLARHQVSLVRARADRSTWE
jgi:hypothetical protein